MAKDYEQSILDLHSTVRLRRTALDHPPEPEVPWHEYPVPTHMRLYGSTTWTPWLPGYNVSALKYSDGSSWEEKSNGAPATPPKKPNPSPAILEKTNA